MITEAKQMVTINSICAERRFQRLFAHRLRQHLAKDIVNWTTDIYNAGTFDRSILEKRVKQRLRQEYGSIVVTILLTVAWSIIWEIIKRKLLG